MRSSRTPSVLATHHAVLGAALRNQTDHRPTAPRLGKPSCLSRGPASGSGPCGRRRRPPPAAAQRCAPGGSRRTEPASPSPQTAPAEPRTDDAVRRAGFGGARWQRTREIRIHRRAGAALGTGGGAGPWGGGGGRAGRGAAGRGRSGGAWGRGRGGGGRGGSAARRGGGGRAGRGGAVGAGRSGRGEAGRGRAVGAGRGAPVAIESVQHVDFLRNIRNFSSMLAPLGGGAAAAASVLAFASVFTSRAC